MTIARLATVCALFVCVCVGSARTARTMEVPPLYRIPPGARQLCSEHVTGTTAHITWTSFAVRQTVPQVRAFYEGLGLRFTVGGEGSVTHAPDPDHRLEVFRASGTYPSCEERPLPTERAVIVRSRCS